MKDERSTELKNDQQPTEPKDDNQLNASKTNERSTESKNDQLIESKNDRSTESKDDSPKRSKIDEQLTDSKDGDQIKRKRKQKSVDVQLIGLDGQVRQKKMRRLDDDQVIAFGDYEQSHKTSVPLVKADDQLSKTRLTGEYR